MPDSSSLSGHRAEFHGAGRPVARARDHTGQGCINDLQIVRWGASSGCHQSVFQFFVAGRCHRLTSTGSQEGVRYLDTLSATGSAGVKPSSA